MKVLKLINNNKGYYNIHKLFNPEKWFKSSDKTDEEKERDSKFWKWFMFFLGLFLGFILCLKVQEFKSNYDKSVIEKGINK